MQQKVEKFFSEYTKRTYKKRETIIRADDQPMGVYYVVKGSVRQYMVSGSGEIFMVHVYKPGSFFPLMWAINDIPNSFYFDAVVQAEIVRAPRDKVIAFLKRNPDVLFHTLERILSGLHGFVTRVSHVVLDDAHKKTALLLLYFAKNFGEKTDAGITLKFPLVHREIAAWIGTTRETASLQIEALQKKGIISTQGRHIVITNLKLLEGETQ